MYLTGNTATNDKTNIGAGAANGGNAGCDRSIQMSWPMTALGRMYLRGAEDREPIMSGAVFDLYT